MSNAFERDTKRHDAGMNPSFIQVGIVKDNRDPHKMGRLKVWPVGSSSAEDNKNSWVTCSYSTPFGGRTQGSPNADSYDEFPKSYGFWAVPPDVGTRVFIFFVNGNIESAYWFGCAYDHLMNHQVPGPHTKVLGDSTLDAAYPVTEFDRNTPAADINAQYPNVPLIDSLQRQGLLFDPVKGTPDRSARRQTPGTMYGMTSPRGNHIVLDDGYTQEELNAATWDDDQDGFQNTEYGNPTGDTRQGARQNEGIVLRTRSGAQILVSETEGNIFIINRDGTSRIEMDAEGNVTINADKDISVRAKQDINYYAERDMNVEVLGNMNTKVHGNVQTEILGKRDTWLVGNDQLKITEGSKNTVIDTGTLSYNAKGNIVFKTDADYEQTSSNTKITTSKHEVSGTSIVGGSANVGGSLIVGSGINAGGDVKTAKVSLNNHVHTWITSAGKPAKTTPSQGGGGNASPDGVSSLNGADENEVVQFEPLTYTDVVDVNPDSRVNEKIIADLDAINDKSLSALGWVMPVTGKVNSDGYWGRSVYRQNGQITDNTGWTISLSDNSQVVSPAYGYVREVSANHIIIDHRNGYITVYRGLRSTNHKQGVEVQTNTTLGASSGGLLFEVRRSSSSYFGFEGTVDPGLFFIEITNTSIDSGGVSLTQGKPSRKISESTTVSEQSSEVVKLVEIKSIISRLPASGYLEKPQEKIAEAPVYQTSNTSTVNLPDSQPIVAPSEPIPIEWVVTQNDSDLINEVIQSEGSKAYQKHVGYYRNGKFMPYRDSLGFLTVGYGHLIKPSENFNAGLTDAQATQLLSRDLTKAVYDAKSIAKMYSMVIPRDAQKVLVEMVFQLGKGGTLAFKKFLAALADNNYSLASHEMKDSRWYRQTPNRVQKHVNTINRL